MHADIQLLVEAFLSYLPHFREAWSHRLLEHPVLGSVAHEQLLARCDVPRGPHQRAAQTRHLHKLYVPSGRVDAVIHVPVYA